MGYSLLGSSVHGILQGKNTGVGCHFLLQGIFPIQGVSPGLPVLQTDSVLSDQGSPKIQPILTEQQTHKLEAN